MIAGSLAAAPGEPELSISLTQAAMSVVGATHLAGRCQRGSTVGCHVHGAVDSQVVQNGGLDNATDIDSDDVRGSAGDRHGDRLALTRSNERETSCTECASNQRFAAAVSVATVGHGSGVSYRFVAVTVPSGSTRAC